MGRFWGGGEGGGAGGVLLGWKVIRRSNTGVCTPHTHTLWSIWECVCGASITVRHGRWAHQREIHALGSMERSWLLIQHDKGLAEYVCVCVRVCVCALVNDHTVCVCVCVWPSTSFVFFCTQSSWEVRDRGVCVCVASKRCGRGVKAAALKKSSLERKASLTTLAVCSLFYS